MKKSYRILLFNLLLFVVIALVVAVQVITYVQTKSLLQANRAVLQTQQIIGVLDRITISTIDLSSTTRDYILTGDNSRIKEFHKMAQSIDTNKKLKTGMKLLEQRNLEMALLNQLSSVLQSCNSVEETYGFIEKFANKILPNTAGALYVFNKPQQCLEYACAWNSPAMKEALFPAEHCFALRRGQRYIFGGIDHGIPCKHVESVATSVLDAFCIPLVTHNEPLGMLYLETKTEQENGFHRLTADESKKLLSVLLVEEIALSVTNIKLRESLRQRSMRDPLTGLFNRNFLSEALVLELHRAKRNNSSLAFVMLDLDNFKQINDTYGHDAGDLVLRSVDEVLLKNIRDSDLVCRYGGEEFLILLFDADAKRAFARIEHVREAVGRLQLSFSEQTLNRITVSSGISIFPQHSNESATLIQKADKALYEAKHAGRNCTMIYSEHSESKSESTPSN